MCHSHHIKHHANIAANLRVPLQACGLMILLHFRPHRMAEWVERPFWEIRESEPCEFELWSSQTNDFKIDTCHFLVLALLGYGKNWLAQWQDNVTEWDGWPVGQHYNVVMSVKILNGQLKTHDQLVWVLITFFRWIYVVRYYNLLQFTLSSILYQGLHLKIFEVKKC